mmetsp:Transcript_23109/g.69301  ORF Transcript_23109/g.69301 Transcript_23109/m.69301 type:complete len:409 (+) Transcript_23109:236-1462(+)
MGRGGFRGTVQGRRGVRGRFVARRPDRAVVFKRLRLRGAAGLRRQRVRRAGHGADPLGLFRAARLPRGDGGPGARPLRRRRRRVNRRARGRHRRRGARARAARGRSSVRFAAAGREMLASLVSLRLHGRALAGLVRGAALLRTVLRRGVDVRVRLRRRWLRKRRALGGRARAALRPPHKRYGIRVERGQRQVARVGAAGVHRVRREPNRARVPEAAPGRRRGRSPFTIYPRHEPALSEAAAAARLDQPRLADARGADRRPHPLRGVVRRRLLRARRLPRAVAGRAARGRPGPAGDGRSHHTPMRRGALPARHICPDRLGRRRARLRAGGSAGGARVDGASGGDAEAPRPIGAAARRRGARALGGDVPGGWAGRVHFAGCARAAAERDVVVARFFFARDAGRARDVDAA